MANKRAHADFAMGDAMRQVVIHPPLEGGGGDMTFRFPNAVHEADKWLLTETLNQVLKNPTRKILPRSLKTPPGSLDPNPIILIDPIYRDEQLFSYHVTVSFPIDTRVIPYRNASICNIQPKLIDHNLIAEEFDLGPDGAFRQFLFYVVYTTTRTPPGIETVARLPMMATGGSAPTPAPGSENDHPTLLESALGVFGLL